MFNKLRFDGYAAAPFKMTVANFIHSTHEPILVDTPYHIMPIYKEMLIINGEVTTSAALTGATLEFSVRNNKNLRMAAFFQDLSIASALDAEALTIGASFTKYKPHHFTLYDCNLNETGVTLSDFNTLGLYVTIKNAASIPDDFMLNITIGHLYKA